ncbi:MAG: YaaR family protein [Treponema sp.]|nr:YaaR family protein [Treponema sp.]
MSSIDQINTSLYFSAVSSAAGETAKKARKKEKTAGSTRLNVFTTELKRNEELNELVAAGLPAEIAAMSMEDAVVFLKDRVTMAGDELVEKMSGEAFAKYRQMISQLMKFVIKYSYELEQHKRLPDRRTHREKAPFINIEVINSKLDQLASEILANQADKLKLLKRVEEVQGLIVDMFAS